MTKQTVTLHPGDCLDVMRKMVERKEKVDSIVTDPPYHLTSIVKRFGKEGAAEAKSNGATGVYKRPSAGFMGKQWDGGDIAFDPETWKLAYAVLKPGGYLLAFGGTRTFHRMAVAIEDAGFEIRDTVMWLYGTGFPKSLNIGKAIDKAAGAERTVLETKITKSGGMAHIMKTNQDQGYRPGDYYADTGNVIEVTAPATPEAAQWEGWGTALKPAWEPIIVARKPVDGTVAANVLAHGVGGMNIDGCRVGFTDDDDKAAAKPAGKTTSKSGNLAGKAQDGFVIRGPTDDGEVLYWSNSDGFVNRESATIFSNGEDISDPIGATGREPATLRAEFEAVQGTGRWPANVIHDGSEEVLEAFAKYGDRKAGGAVKGTEPSKTGGPGTACYGEYDRVAWEPYQDTGSAARFFYSAKANKADRSDSKHPTVKPISLMRYLTRLVTPPGGMVLDPFAGSGTTGQAAFEEGFNAILIEREADYQSDICRRFDKLVADGKAIEFKSVANTTPTPDDED